MKKIPKEHFVASFLTAVALFYFMDTPKTNAAVFLTRGMFVWVVLAAVFTMIFRAYKIYRRKQPASLVVFLTPVIATVLSLYGCFMLENIDKKAKNYLWELAVEIQKTCRDKRDIPSTLDGWTKRGDWYRTTIDIEKTKYEFFYFSLPEKKQFVIGIHYLLDSRFELTGGIDKAVEQYRWVDP